MTVICICLFVGAMGKSAQMPLHVWLPDSMEGPTPISALIHAATMVTAGIFMVARMSPLFEYSPTALSFVLVIGATTALFMGFLGIVNNDIKRVIAYSTLSQLGYMTVALGVSGYSVAIFHLMTHAFFKALLFLAAGAVIIAMHHEQDMRKMGGLRRRMPVTYWTALIGALALIGTPFFSGFYSKDTLIDAVHASHRYRRRLRLLVRAAGRVRDRAVHVSHDLHDLPWPGAPRSSRAGALSRCRLGHEGAAGGAGDPIAADRLPDGRADAVRRLFRRCDPVLASHDVVGELRPEWHGPLLFALAASLAVGPGWLAGARCADRLVVRAPAAAGRAMRCASASAGSIGCWSTSTTSTGSTRTCSRRWRAGSASLLWRGGDQAVIDGALVNGTAGRWAGSPA